MTGANERRRAKQERATAVQHRQLAANKSYEERQRRMMAAALHDEAAPLLERLATVYDLLNSHCLALDHPQPHDRR